jgi:hypothetical protein
MLGAKHNITIHTGSKFPFKRYPVVQDIEHIDQQVHNPCMKPQRGEESVKVA